MNDTMLVIAVLVIAGVVLVSVQTRLSALGQHLDRLARVEGKLDVIMKNLGVQYDPLAGFPAEALAALRQGRKIEAIKSYRHATGAGLKEAKDMIDEASRRLPSIT